MKNSIKKENVERLLSLNQVLIIDVRSAEEYAQQHIPSAINLPLDEIPQRLKELPTDRLLVTACGKGGGRSEQGAQLLTENGFEASFLEGGTFGWE